MQGGGGASLFERARRTAGLLLSREVTVLNNAIAFNVLLCLFPLLLVLVAAAQRLAPGGATSVALRLVLSELIPIAPEALAGALRQMTRLAPGFQLLSLALVVWGSSGTFIPVERVLNIVWGASAERHFWKSRLLAFLLTLAGAGLALGSVALTLFGRNLKQMAAAGWQLEGPLTLVGGWAAKLAALGFGWAFFTLVYRVAPSARVDLSLAWRAGLWAACAWELSKYVFVWNLERMQLATFYGPLALAVALVLWAYVSSMVLVFGAGMAAPPGGRSARTALRVA
jgi:YihY family inner membrane protein